MGEKNSENLLTFKELPVLKKGDKIAIISPSFAAPGKWPHIYELGLKRLREEFGLEPVEYPTTKKIGATGNERANDIISAFSNPDIKAVIASLGGDDQVTYIYKQLIDKKEVFQNNPKPFFGYSDNTQFVNFLWLCGIPSFYGGALFTEFGEQGYINPFTVEYLNKAFFQRGWVTLTSSTEFSDEGLNWNDPTNLNQRRRYQQNEGWYWEGTDKIVEGYTWGGCLEALEDTMMHGQPLPTVEQLKNVILVLETSEEMPDESRVFHILRAMGERGILGAIRGVVIGRPKAWEWGHELNDEQKEEYKKEQRKVMLETIQKYNPKVPIIFNLDIGHTSPQIQLPMGNLLRILPKERKIEIKY